MNGRGPPPPDHLHGPGTFLGWLNRYRLAVIVFVATWMVTVVLLLALGPVLHVWER